jgi:hypothetical protein
VTPQLCTLAIHAPYWRRAKLLCQDVAPNHDSVLTDNTAAFTGMSNVTAVAHRPTGPMAVDYLTMPLNAVSREGGGPKT